MDSATPSNAKVYVSTEDSKQLIEVDVFRLFNFSISVQYGYTGGIGTFELDVSPEAGWVLEVDRKWLDSNPLPLYFQLTCDYLTEGIRYTFLDCKVDNTLKHDSKITRLEGWSNELTGCRIV